MVALGRQLWDDCDGFVVSSELVLIATIVVVGLITGLTTIRDQVVLELGDVSTAIRVVDQGYSLSGVSSHSGSTAGSQFDDESDFCGDAIDDFLGNPVPAIFINVTSPTGE